MKHRYGDTGFRFLAIDLVSMSTAKVSSSVHPKCNCLSVMVDNLIVLEDLITWHCDCVVVLIFKWSNNEVGNRAVKRAP